MSVDSAWRGILSNADLPTRVANVDEIDEIIEIMRHRRIDAKVFTENLLSIEAKGGLTYDPFIQREQPEVSPSARYLSSPAYLPLNTPFWVLAAFPDVIVWLQETQLKTLADSRKSDAPEMLHLYGIDAGRAETMTEEAFLNSDRQIRAKWYSSLIESYVSGTGKQLEVSIGPGSPNDMYASEALINTLGAEDAYGLIAMNTATCYAVLKTGYANRFRDEMSLIATAGAIDAAAYIGLRQITVREIQEMSAKCSGSSFPLLEFVLLLEMRIFEIDAPEYGANQIRSSIRQQSGEIEKVIRSIMEGRSAHNPAVAAAADQFMKDWRNRKIRKQLGIANG